VNSPEEVVRFYLKRIDEAPHPVEKRILKRDLHLYHYRLTADDAKSVEVLMEPFMRELELEIIEKDPLLKRAHEMLSAFKARRSVQV
jgi:hypothetical protein